MVTDYRDDSEGVLVEHADGSGEFARVTLKPRMTIANGGRVNEPLKFIAGRMRCARWRGR